ncbi:terminase, partial [Salmonella enterica]|nr:terminase [Salmonella enterica]
MSSSPQLSLVSKQEAAAELLKRRNARASLHDFIQYINPEYITSKFSQTVCDALDQFLLDMMNGVRPILILGAPPQHGKSDIVSRYLPAYFFGKYPEMRVGALSYSADLAGDMNSDVQRIMSTAE